MIQRLLKNDIQNQKLLSITTIFFMSISSLMIVLSISLFTTLWTSLSTLMEQAKTPDFLQMHTGEINVSQLEEFAKSHQEIINWQVLELSNLDNNEIYLGKTRLTGNTQDNSICVQSSSFDYLLDMNNQLPTVKDGEVYVPIAYKNQYNLDIYDTMQIGNTSLQIAGFIRDSQMNSMMASSKRFLVSATDYENLKSYGSKEYLIEYLLEEQSDMDSFHTNYFQQGLPSNGPTITKPLIKLMNALSDGLLILVLFLVGIAILSISLLCIRFITSLGVERDRKEAGLLKAIGLSKKEIRKLYFSKYVLFSSIGAIVGLLGAWLIQVFLSASIQELYGPSNQKQMIFIVSILVCILVQGILLFSIRLILSRLEKMSALEALRSQNDYRLKKDRGQKLVLVLVSMVCVYLSFIPQNLSTTLASKEFVRYMGIGDAQIRIDMHQNENMEDSSKELVQKLVQDSSIENYVALKTVSCQVSGKEDIQLLIEEGNHSTFPVRYSQGKEPVNKNEIALSLLQAQDLEVQVGDTLSIGKEEVDICGIYSDITNGGKTSKMTQLPTSCSENKALWNVFYVTLKDPSKIKNWIDSYQGEDKDIVDIADYVQATYGPTIEQVKKAKSVALILSILIIFVVDLLFVTLIMEKERQNISLQKALGFSNRSLQKQYGFKLILPIVLGLLLGLLSSNIVGENLCALALESLGASGFTFVLDIPVLTMEFGILVSTSIIAVYTGTKSVYKIKAYECCKGKE
ncbi:MAG: FtsX-like permease family protein [Bacillota bacterium]|nr:FtsX-like permease family protein [Bacillota bacterium]